MKYILFVVISIAVVFGSFIMVIEANEKVVGIKHARYWNDIKTNYEEPATTVYRRARDGLLS